MQFNNIHKSYAARFLMNLNFFGAVSVPFFVDWLQVDYTRIFLLQAWFQLWIFLLEVPTGAVADKYGRKLSIALGSLLFGADLLIFGLVRDYYILFLAEFIGAAGFTLISGADKALIYDSLIEMKKEEEANHYLSRYEAAGTLGILISFPLGSMIVRLESIPYPRSLPLTFIISGITSVLALFVCLSMKEPVRYKLRENFIITSINGLKYLHKHRILRIFAFNSVLISAVTFFMFWFYQPLAGSSGIDVAYYGFIGAGFNLFASLLLLNSGKLEKTFGMKNILFYSALIPGLMYIGSALTSNVYFILFAIFLVTGLKLLRGPLLSSFMNKHIESVNRATVLSSVSLLERIVVMVLYPIIGFLADISLNYALLLLGALALIFTFVTRIEQAQIEARTVRYTNEE